MDPSTTKEISCRVTRTLLMYVREANSGTLGPLLDGLELDEPYLADTNHWVSHAFLQKLYQRMVDLLADPNAVYKMAYASGRFQSTGILDRMVRLLGNPRLTYALAPKYNKFLKANGDVIVREAGRSWVVIEDRYHHGHQKTRYDCDYTRGILAAIPTLFDLPSAQIEELECQVRPEIYGTRRWTDCPPYGCKGCLYRVQWDTANQPSFLKQAFGRYRIYQKAIDDLQNANRLIQEKYDEVSKLASRLEKANQELVDSKRQLETYTADLEASEQRYRHLAENVTDNIWTIDLNTLAFTYISPSVMKMRGYTAQEAMAMSIEETLTAESLEEVTRILTEELAREEDPDADPHRSRTIEVQLLCNDRSAIYAEVTTSFIRDETGQPVGLLGITRDITARKQAEALYQEKIAAEAASQAKSNFLAHMSHEFRTPLNHIIGFTELLAKKHVGDLNEVQEDYLNDVLHSSNHLLDMVNDILDLSKVEAGKLALEPRDIDLWKLLEQSVKIIKEPATARGIQVDLAIDDVPPNIQADGRKLRQIMFNLLSNAEKFSLDGGSIHISAKGVTLPAGMDPNPDAEPTGDCVQIAVSDTGIGIDANNQERLFKPFEQVGDSYSRKHPGTGLGLSLTKALVELHGGIIQVESPGEGQGATFTFTIPVQSQSMDKSVEAT